MRKALVFIDGIESDIDELKRMDIKNVNKIEVISNPSLSYGTDFSGGVIQVITKKKKERYFKGEVETFLGLRLNSRGLVPSVSFKTKQIIFNGFYSYVNNNQNIKSDIEREDNGNHFSQNSYRTVNGWQDYLNSKIKILLSSKSFLNLSGKLSGYDLKSKTEGSYDDGGINNFNIDSSEKVSNGFASGIYNYNFNENNKLVAKYKYLDYTVDNHYKYYGHDDNPTNTVSSRIKEHSIEIVYAKNNSKLFEFPLEYSAGYKSIFRNYVLNPTNFNLKQRINLIYVDSDIEINNNSSLFASLAYDISNNKSQGLEQKYNYVLSTFSWLYKFNDKNSFKFNYSRRLTRPSPEHLNSSDIFFNPSFILRGNLSLVPQTRNLYEIRLSRKLKNNNSISLNIYNKQTRNGIVKTIFNENNNIITSFENAGKTNSYGINLGINSKLFKLISLNFNSGIRYDHYRSDSDSSLIKENKGISFNSSIYLYALIKKEVSLSLIGNFNSPVYSLISKTNRNPFLSFEAEKSFLKNKLNFRLSYSDMFGLSTKTISNIVYANFNQHSVISNRMTNVTISIVYSFGKDFNSRFSNPVINNNDLKLK